MTRPRTQLMGILNLTPDSFSADGVMLPEQIQARFEALVQAGADIVDIGAESTRPGAQKLSDAQEWERLAPALAMLANHPARAQVRLSLDSYHASSIAKALAIGVDIVNDVTGLRDDAMCAAVRNSTAPIVVMHALSVPADPAITLPADADMLQTLLAWKAEVAQRARDEGIDPARLIFDPGIGFGKTANQNYAILQVVPKLLEDGGRWLVGHSRKSFLKIALGAEASIAARDDATLVLSALLMQAGVPILRVHDVARHHALREAL